MNEHVLPLKHVELAINTLTSSLGVYLPTFNALGSPADSTLQVALGALDVASQAVGRLIVYLSDALDATETLP
jgi:hypothetical protein